MVAPQFIALLGQSNNIGLCIASNVTNHPGFATPYPAVPMMDRNSRLFDPPEVVSDPPTGSRALGPRTISIGSPYNVGTCGIERTYGERLDTAYPGRWRMGKVGLDGAGLQNQWMPGGAYPTGGPPWFSQVVGYLQTMQTAMGAQLAGVSWLGGTTDALEVPDQDNHLANLTTFFTALRAVSGWSNVAIVIDQISSQFIANFPGASVGGPKVRAAQQAFVATTARCALVGTDDLALRPDNAHFADDSYATLGIRHAVAMLALLNPAGSGGGGGIAILGPCIGLR